MAKRSTDGMVRCSRTFVLQCFHLVSKIFLSTCSTFVNMFHNINKCMNEYYTLFSLQYSLLRPSGQTYILFSVPSSAVVLGVRDPTIPSSISKHYAIADACRASEKQEEEEYTDHETLEKRSTRSSRE